MSTELEILYDHYKDTYNNIKSRERNRSIFFIASGVIIFFLLLLCVEPTASISVITSIIKQQIGADVINIFPIIISALWVSLLYTTLSYYQICINIERQYKYLNNIETLLANALGKEFSREGKSYNSKYPLLSNIAYYFYTFLFPIIFIACILLKLITEIRAKNNYFVFDLCVGIIIILFIICYCISRIKKKEDKIDPN